MIGPSLPGRNGVHPSTAAKMELTAAGAVTEAQAAQPGWASVPIQERVTVVRRARHLMAAHAHELEEAAGAGKSCQGVERAVEVLSLAEACRFLERNAVRVLRPRRLGARGRPVWLPGVRAEVRREPFGTVLIVGPSNYPLLLPGVQAVQALVAGNAVVCKPGSGGGVAARRLAELVRSAGLPPGLFNVLPETVESAQQAIAAGVDKVVLTGSAEAGAAVLAELAPRLVPATMELSGCDAAFILPGADLNLITRALVFALRWNGGATCIAPRRVFVPRALTEELEARLTWAACAATLDICTSHHAAVAARLLNDAISRGARLVVGGMMTDGLALRPVVLTDVTADMAIAREEAFAPVLSLIPVAGMEEALAAGAICPYALGASVFGPEDAAREFAARLAVGTVVVNDVIVPTADPRLPFGGRRRSGFGTTRGAEGLLEMTVAKVIAVRSGGWLPHLDPTHAEDAELVRACLRAVHGSTWCGRLKSWWALLRHLFRRRSMEEKST